MPEYRNGAAPPRVSSRAANRSSHHIAASTVTNFGFKTRRIMLANFGIGTLGDRLMFRLTQSEGPARLRRGWRGALVAGFAALLSACGGGMPDIFNNSPSSPPPAADQPTQGAIGAGQIKVGLLLPLSGSGNAGAAGQSMRNRSELALSEFNNPNIQLLVKDDSGSAQGAQQATQQALDEGAEIILGPPFSASATPRS